MSFLASPWFYWSVVVIYCATVLGLAGVIVSENRNPLKSLAWVTVLLTLPVGGLVLYLFFGRSIKNTRMISRRKKRALKRLEERAAPFPKPSGEDPITLTRENAQLAMMAMKVNDSRFMGSSRVEIFTSGSDKFRRLKEDINSARKCISLQYYIFEEDVLGQEIAALLIAKAREGITVRVIYDDIGSIGVSRKFYRAMAEAGVQVYPFFRVTFPPFATRINWRNHRKICVIDGTVGYIGGMNVADRYVDGGKLFDLWRDLHLRVEGPAVASLQQAFAVDWNFMGKELLDTPVEARPVSGCPPMGMQLIAGGPTSRWMNMTLIFQKAISSARKCVYIQTPYFLPSEGLLHALEMCALSKVDVRVMLPRRSDSDMLRWASFSYISECLRAGIKFYLYEKGMLHSKAIIIDDELATVGSCNFDFRSFEHNFEANMLVYSRDFNQRMKRIFLRDQADSLRIMPDTWRRRPIAERAMESFMRLFAPIL